MKRRVMHLLNSIFKIMYRFEKIVPYTWTQSINYFVIMRKPLSLKEPNNFNEKIQWLKAYYRDSKIVQCADKYEVREIT